MTKHSRKHAYSFICVLCIHISFHNFEQLDKWKCHMHISLKFIISTLNLFQFHSY